MCVIAFAPKGVKAPTKDKLKAMWLANSDGAGFAYNGKNGEVVFRKGFMTFEALMAELEPLDQWTNTNFAIHFRIGTAGKNDEHTCHPFPLSTDFAELRKTSGEGKPVLFHNGVLDSGGLASPLSSDTQDFVIAFAPLLAKPFKSKVRDKWLEEIVTGNRLLIMYKNNKVKMFGKWEKDGDLFVSNNHYQSYELGGYGYYGYGSYSYPSYYRPYSYDFEDEDEEYMSYWKKKAEEAKKDTDLEAIRAQEIYDEVYTYAETYLDEKDMHIAKKYADNFGSNYLVKEGIYMTFVKDKHLNYYLLSLAEASMEAK